MSTAVATPPAAPTTPVATTYPIKEPWLSKRMNQVLVVLGVWIVLYFFLKGHWTFADGQPTTAAQDKLQTFSATLTSSRGTNPFFVYFIDPIRNVLDTYVTTVQDWIHSIGWTGPTFLATAIALVWAGWKYAILALLGFLSFGVLGLFTESMDTLTYTLCAVALSVLIGVLIGIYAGLSRRFNAFITPILDFMQILPTFAYLPLVTLFFLIGPASSLIVTMIYAVPPVIRLTAVGIREVSGTTVEAARSIGSTRLQLLRKVQLPMAKNTIVLGINQTTMAALSMVTIAALIGAPGLGQVVIKAIDALDIGAAFNAGLAIVVMAIVLDRVTTGVSQRTEKIRRSGRVLRALVPAGDVRGRHRARRLRHRAGPAVRLGERLPRAVDPPHLRPGPHGRPLVRAARAERDAGVQRLVHAARHRAGHELPDELAVVARRCRPPGDRAGPGWVARHPDLRRSACSGASDWACGTSRCGRWARS